MLQRFAHEWARDHASLMAAGVAFYAIFSIAPLLSLLLLAGSATGGGGNAHQRLVAAIRDFVTPKTAAAVARLTDTIAAERSSGVTLISSILLIFGASAVFSHLRGALDVVMDVPDSERPGWLQWIIGRAMAVVMVVAMMLFLLVSIIATAALTLISRFVPQALADSGIIWRAVELTVSTILLAVLAGIALRYVPAVRLPWRANLWGAFTTACLFSIGRFAVSAYLAHADIVSAYGAAGSLLIVLLAVYFAVLSLIAGAETAELIARSDPRFASERERQQTREGYVARKGEAAADA